MNLKIKVPEGHVIDQEKSTYENIVFKKVDNEKAKEKRFLELFQGLTMKSDIEKYPDSVFYFKNDVLMLEILKKDLFVNNMDIWLIFDQEFDMTYDEIQIFIKSMVEKHFNWKGFIPKSYNTLFEKIIGNHFK